MILQPFIKGGTERISYGKYEYPSGADIIFDFGNPTCTSEFTSNRRVYNVGTANITGSLIPYNNPGPFYPTLTTEYGGAADFRTQGVSGPNYLTWDWKSTQNQTNILIHQIPSGSTTRQTLYYPLAPTTNAQNYIELELAVNNNLDPIGRLYGYIANSSGTPTLAFDNVQIDTRFANSRNGWNVIGITSNGSNNHALYLNETTSSVNTSTITRVDSGTQTTNLAIPKAPISFNAVGRVMGFLQYPRVLSPKELRQVYKVFAQRFG